MGASQCRLVGRILIIGNGLAIKSSHLLYWRRYGTHASFRP
jgi:hypothetical protein